MQGSLWTGLIPHLSFAVLIIIRCRYLRLLSDLLVGIVACACCRIGWAVSLFAFVVGFVVWCRCLRLLLCLLFGVVICVCWRIGCWVVSLPAFVGGFIGWCRCLCLLSDLLGGADVSAVGTTLLQSPGWNEGKARNETLGKYGQKNKSSVGAALSARAFVMDRLVPPLWGSINVFLRLTQGLRPGLCRSTALSGLLAEMSTTYSLK